MRASVATCGIITFVVIYVAISCHYLLDTFKAAMSRESLVGVEKDEPMRSYEIINDAVRMK